VTIDERLDRLTERHEALTQSVESVVRMTQDNARQIGELREAASALLQIVQIHENRISGLEGSK
jgi:cell division septum initiation protein DivIVA